MLNYDFTIGAYEQVLKQNENDTQVAECVGAKLSALRLLNGRSEDEIYNLFDTGAFNDIVISYVKSAMGNSGLSDHCPSVLEELKFLFDAVGAEQICETCENVKN